MEGKFKRRCDQLFDVIFKTASGTIYRNGVNKNIYMIEFGNMFLSMTHDNMDRFENFLSNTNDEELQKLMIPSIEKIVIQPMKSLGSYAFNFEEFKNLQELVTGAKNIILIEKELVDILN